MGCRSAESAPQGRRVVDVFAQRCGRPGDLLRNGCDFGRDVEWRRQGQHCSAGGRQQVHRIVLRQFCDQRYVGEQLHRRPEGACGRRRRPGSTNSGMRARTFGGPIRRDRMWFFVAHRCAATTLSARRISRRTRSAVGIHAGPFAAVALGRLGFGQPDPRHGPGDAAQQSVRLLRQGQQVQLPDRPGLNPLTGESATSLTYPSVYLASLSWQAPITSKLLWDSAYSFNHARTTSGRPSLLELRRRRRFRCSELSTFHVHTRRRFPVIPSVFPGVFSRAAKTITRITCAGRSRMSPGHMPPKSGSPCTPVRARQQRSTVQQ
mgnify:CR=1 FL=1